MKIKYGMLIILLNYYSDFYGMEGGTPKQKNFLDGRKNSSVPKPGIFYFPKLISPIKFIVRKSEAIKTRCCNFFVKPFKEFDNLNLMRKDKNDVSKPFKWFYNNVYGSMNTHILNPFTSIKNALRYPINLLKYFDLFHKNFLFDTQFRHDEYAGVKFCSFLAIVYAVYKYNDSIKDTILNFLNKNHFLSSHENVANILTNFLLYYSIMQFVNILNNNLEQNDLYYIRKKEKALTAAEEAEEELIECVRDDMQAQVEENKQSMSDILKNIQSAEEKIKNHQKEQETRKIQDSEELLNVVSRKAYERLCDSLATSE